MIIREIKTIYKSRKIKKFTEINAPIVAADFARKKIGKQFWS